MENQQASGLQVEQEPLFEIQMQYRGEGELPDLTATKLPPGSRVYKAAGVPEFGSVGRIFARSLRIVRKILSNQESVHAIRGLLP